MQEASPFDILAKSYDQDFTHTAIGKLQRERVWSILTPLLGRLGNSLNILEINCGTGEDALRLASLGHQVWATDASVVMIKKAKQKAGVMYNGKLSVNFMQCSFKDIATHFNHLSFDIVLSNFGGLNCISSKELEELNNSFATITHAESRLVFVVMSRYCVWETLFFALKGNLKKAFRRQKKSVVFSKGESDMNIYYYRPKDFRNIFSSSFKQENVLPVGFAIPPSYLESFFSKRSGWLKWLQAWDNGWANKPFLSGLSDHFCITLKKISQ